MLQLLLGKADIADRASATRSVTLRRIQSASMPRTIGRYALISHSATVCAMKSTAPCATRTISKRSLSPEQVLLQVGHGINGIHNVDYHDFAPHLGFAWDIRGNGKTALRGGYSLTYDVPNFGAFADPYSFAGAAAGVFTQPISAFLQFRFWRTGVGTKSSLPIRRTMFRRWLFRFQNRRGTIHLFLPGTPVYGPIPTG